jgi:hypothetical protein
MAVCENERLIILMKNAKLLKKLSAGLLLEAATFLVRFVRIFLDPSIMPSNSFPCLVSSSAVAIFRF